MEWSGPFDPELAAFHTITRTLSHTLRETVEGMAVGHFASGLSLVPPLFWPTVVQQLPFHSAPHSFHAGTVMSYALFRSLDTSPSSSRVTVAELGRVFPDWTGGKADVWWWWMFWRKAMRMFYVPATATPPPSAMHGVGGGDLYPPSMTERGDESGLNRTGEMGMDGFYAPSSPASLSAQVLERAYEEVEILFGEENMRKMQLADQAVSAMFRSLLFSYMETVL